MTALVGMDYTSTSGTATIPAGQISKTIQVPITRDSIAEGDETFQMTPSGGSRYTFLGSMLTVATTIADDESSPTLSLGNISLREGTGGYNIGDAHFSGQLAFRYGCRRKLCNFQWECDRRLRFHR